MKLSVAIATYNEEKNIGRCLESVRPWADEIIVVDGSSEDKTREIAEKYGAVVIKTTNKLLFHINKQMAIDRCRGEWILQLDADEVVTKDLKEEIQSIVKKSSFFAGYFIPRKNYFLGRRLKKTGQYPDLVIRFFKKGKARLPCKSVHEQMEVEGEIGKLKGHLLHYPYPTFFEYLRKSNLYTTLTASELLKTKKKPTVLGLLLSCLKFEFTFWKLFLRHKGFLDGVPGFVFSFFSGLHHFISYIKFWEKYDQKSKD